MSFSRFVFTSFLLTALSVPTHAFPAQESTPDDTANRIPEAVGEYILIRANAQELPAVVSESGGSRQEVVGGSLRLEADGTHVWMTRYRYTDGGVTDVSESSGRGSYSQQGTSITILFEAGGCCEGILDGSTLTIQTDVALVYRKIFGQVPTQPFTVPNRGDGSTLPLPPPPPTNRATFALSITPDYLPGSLEQLCDSSTLIVEAHVEAIQSPEQNLSYPPGTQLVQERSRPIFLYLETDAILVVSQVLKGSESIRQVVISQKGGVLGRYTELPIQYDLLEEEEHYILFLTDELRPNLPEVSGIPRYALNGSWTGMFRIDEGRVYLSPDAAAPIRERLDGRSSREVIAEIRVCSEAPSSR